MVTKIILIFVSCGVLLQGIKAQSGPCDQQLNNFRSCVRNIMQQDSNDATANQNKRNQIENDFRSCVTQGGCSDPFPSNSEKNARTQCFNDARNNIRSQIEQCVRRQTGRNDFKLPQDDSDKDAYWRFEMFRVFAAMRNIGDNRYNRNQKNKQNWSKVSPNQPANDVCGNDDNKKQRVTQCIQSKGVFNSSTANSSWRKGTCRIKSQCQQQVSRQCQTDWDNKYSPALCDCVSQAGSNGQLSQLQSQYTQCLRSKGVRLQNEQNDDGRQVIAKMYGDWCSQGKLNSTQKQQQSQRCQRRGNSNSNQNGNNGNNQNQNWNNQNNQNNQNWNNQNNQNWNNQNNQNWNNQNNQNWNNQNNQNWNSDPNGYDDGSSYSSGSSGTDLFSGMLGGGSDPLSSITGGGAGGLLSSFGGGSPLGGLGGGLGSGLLGGGSPLGGLGGGLGSGLLGGGGSPLSALGGGGLGSGLLGGGSPLSSMGALGGGTDLLSTFGGGMDASNLLGGLGGFGF